MRQLYEAFNPRLSRFFFQLPYLRRTLLLVWEVSPRWSTLLTGMLMLRGLLPGVIVVLTPKVVDSVLAAIEADMSWSTYSPALIWVAAMAGVLLLSELLKVGVTWATVVQSETIQDAISDRIHQQAISVDYAFYESSEYYDHLYRATSEARYRPAGLIEGVGGLLETAIALITIGGVLITYNFWLPVILALSMLPILYAILRHQLNEHQWHERVTVDRRRTWYYEWLLSSGENAAEIRLFGIGQYFQKAYQELRQHLRQQTLAFERQRGLLELATGGLALFVTGGVMVWMLGRTIQGVVTLGTLALFYQAFAQAQRLVRQLVQHLRLLYSNSLFLAHLFEFFELEAQIIDPPTPLDAPDTLEKGIRFIDVDFSYPGGERRVLQNFNLFIPAGKIVAIVGANGSGKTTLFKLLCRLYDPDRGRIEVDDVDLKSLRLYDARRMVTALFQEPVQYSDTVSKNVSVGNIDEDMPREQVEALAQATGADQFITRLPQAYDTLLGKWFPKGEQLSVGEWKRLALARAFARPAPIILLDEPTSALDPWAEAQWTQQLRQQVKGRTAVLITHRFSTVVCADYILVMRQGQIVEEGTLEELIATGGEFASTWAMQHQSPTFSPIPDAES